MVALTSLFLIGLRASASGSMASSGCALVSWLFYCVAVAKGGVSYGREARR